MQRISRSLGNRGFADQNLEADFMAAYRSYGVSFLFVASLVGAIYFLVFVLVDLISGVRALDHVVQMARLAVSAGFQPTISRTFSSGTIPSAMPWWWVR
ncbi:MAG: hypothetical protein HYX44_13040 [Aquabacterium sp.]|nr:hypothetical protein [Aquabacterium sp.]